MKFKLRRVYESPVADDGLRVLVDRIWPRGVAKEDLKFDLWMKEVAPSTELRKWFGHDPEKWKEFLVRYHRELDEQPELVEKLRSLARKGNVTLLYAAKDEAHNNAVGLRGHLLER